MPAKLSIHVPGEPVIVRVVDEGRLLFLGRDIACDIVIAHESVSRRHAQILGNPLAWNVSDLGSKNGIRLDGERVTAAELTGACWFAIGDVFCEFERIDAKAQAHLHARAAERRSSSMAWAARIDGGSRSDRLVADLLRGIVDVAECQRGVLLTVDDTGQMRWRASCSLSPEDVAGSRFSGSRSAVERTILDRRPVYLSDPRDRAWLQGQASVIAHGIRALACLPLEHAGRLLGVAYADTSDEQKVFTDLDAELLGAFVDHAASVFAAAELDAQLADMSVWFSVEGTQADRATGVAPYWKSPDASASAGQPA
ncbi:MAG: GAF domain-containing protein [Dokdonella sp.]|uniref:FHA domain-containing protein n=1 Tax=Dokdonella sp. TaxID=2291710 RepID=UPI0032661F56